tara:strand:+ start:3402 stop:4211 length:810 start_codon:yes stop_codon:yes gene_type:complete
MSIFSAIGSGISDLFGGGQEQAYDDEKKALQQIPGIYKQYMNPYLNAGQGAINPYTSALHQLLSNPNGFIGGLQSQAEASYKPSQAYQNQVNAATHAASQAAASGGMLGTPEDQEHVAQTVGNLAMGDQQNYVNNRMKQMLSAYGQGLIGEQGLVGMGDTNAGNMASSLANVQGQIGKAQAGSDMAHSSMLGHALGAVTGLIPGGGGSLLGGLGGDISGAVGHLFGGGMNGAMSNALNPGFSSFSPPAGAALGGGGYLQNAISNELSTY